MTTLSDKLTGITLPIDHFGVHLNTQGKVIDPESNPFEHIQFERMEKEKVEELKRRKKE